MIKNRTTYFSFSGDGVSESEITVEEACRILHSLSWQERSCETFICESDEDKDQLIRTYYDMYHDEFNVQHHISDEEQNDLHLAYPATTDVFYAENLLFHLEVGIRELDPRYARVNTHQTVIYFQMSPLYKCIAVDNAPDEQTKAQMQHLQQNIIHKYEQLNHESYEDAQEYIEQARCIYQELFDDDNNIPDLDKIIAINKNFDIPWYDRLYT